MSEGRELACALHFQLEAAIQFVGALGGCILVVRSPGESDARLLQTLGLQSGEVAKATETQADAHSQAAASSEIGCDSAASATRAATVRLQRSSSGPRPPASLPAQRLVSQFRCVALSGRTAHKAFAHEPMLTGVVESRIALNISLAGEPFLVVPLQHPTNVAHAACAGVLCLAYKAQPGVYQFDGADEAHAYCAAGMIAATLHRCPAAAFVQPYVVARLAPLGLQTSFATSLLPASPTPGGPGPQACTTRGVVYRSSSRAALTAKIDRLHSEPVPSLQSLMELSDVMTQLESLILQQQDTINRHVDTQHVLERRLRSAQQDLSTTRVTAERDKLEGESFRLSGIMMQQKLNEHIARAEVQKARGSETAKAVNEDVIEFIKSAKASLEKTAALSRGDSAVYRNRSVQPPPIATTLTKSRPQSSRVLARVESSASLDLRTITTLLKLAQ